jgi:two-component system, NarL family, nitrate/nitrite response regulator NarL
MDDLLPTLQEQTVLDAAPTGLTIIELLQRIVEHVAKSMEPAAVVQVESGAAQVVLDVCMGSDRYILTHAFLQSSALSAALSPREKEIVRLVAKGLPNKVISDVLDISPWTVATHLRRVFAKLGVSSRAEMVALVIQARLLE